MVVITQIYVHTTQRHTSKLALVGIEEVGPTPAETKTFSPSQTQYCSVCTETLYEWLLEGFIFGNMILR